MIKNNLKKVNMVRITNNPPTGWMVHEWDNMRSPEAHWMVYPSLAHLLHPLPVYKATQFCRGMGLSYVDTIYGGCVSYSAENK